MEPAATAQNATQQCCLQVLSQARDCSLQGVTVLVSWFTDLHSIPTQRDKNEEEEQAMMLHGQTVMRLKETQFQGPVVPVAEQVLNLNIQACAAHPMQ